MASPLEKQPWSALRTLSSAISGKGFRAQDSDTAAHPETHDFLAKESHHSQQISLDSSQHLAHAPHLEMSHADSLSVYMDHLGLKKGQNDIGVRGAFIRDLTDRLKLLDYDSQGKTSNEDVLDEVVQGFLDENGHTYWGATGRDYLRQEEDQQAFIYPLDIDRIKAGLRLIIQYLLEYKTKLHENHDLQNKPEGEGMLRLDFSEMTDLATSGIASEPKMTEDQPPVSSIMGSQYKRSRAQRASHDSSDSWNVFLETETPTRLRPRLGTTQWTNTYTDKDLLGDQASAALVRSKSAKSTNSRRARSVSTPHQPKKPQRGTPQGHKVLNKPILGSPPQNRKGKIVKQTAVTTFIGPNNDSSESDSPLILEAGKYNPTRPEMQSQTTSAVGTSEKTKFLDESTPLGASHPESGITPELILDHSMMDEVNLTSTETVSLSPEARKRTLLLVTADHEGDRAPIAVNLVNCNSSDQFFTKLIYERRLQTFEKKVNMISTTSLWNGKKLGLRKGESGDWDLFMDKISRAWNTEAHKFEDGCEIEVTIHIDG